MRLTPTRFTDAAAFRATSFSIIDALRDLCREGRLVRLKKQSRAARSPEPGYRRIHAHPDGYGFLIPEDKDAEDVYINRREMRRVMHGDQVMVRLDRKHRGGTEAHIAQVLERGQKRLLGTYDEIDGKAYLIPMDPRSRRHSAETAGSEAGKAKSSPRRSPAMAPPCRRRRRRVLRIMGDPDDPEVQAQSMIFRFGLSTEFSRRSRIGNRRNVLTLLPPKRSLRATDLRDLPIVTIDGENARDFDDAVYVRRQGDGYELFVSIADVAYYVRPDSALDQEAYARGTSVYFPDRAIPMLPEALSNGICSLNPNEDRLTKTACIEFNAKGEVIGSRFFNSVIRSHARMTYTDVRRILVDHDTNAQERYKIWSSNSS